MVDYTPLVFAAILGLVGGGIYDYYYKLLTAQTYLQAIWHLACGAAAAVIVVYTGALPAPTDQTTALALAVVGYAGTDLIDSLVEKIASATTVSTPPTAPAGPPAAGSPPAGPT